MPLLPSSSSTALAVTAALGATSLAATSLLWYLGAFRSITFETSQLDGKVFVYQTQKGSYSGIGPLCQTVGTYVADRGIENAPTACLYYDDPKTTKEPRYAVGFLVDAVQWDALKDTIDAAWSVLSIPDRTPTLASTFPMKWIPVSCVLSALKTFPAFEQQGHTVRTGCLEIYDTQSRTVETHFPRDHLDAFAPKETDPFPSVHADDKEKIQ